LGLISSRPYSKQIQDQNLIWASRFGFKSDPNHGTSCGAHVRAAPTAGSGIGNLASQPL